MSLGLILYIEDSEAQRKSLKTALEFRGFTVEVAGNVTEARSKFEQLQGQLDVVVLDMRLEDPQWPQMTGADVAVEYYNPLTPDPPEFLISSAYSEVDYYKLAMKLGTTTYLDKSEYTQDDLIRHVRALTIRRSLDIKRRNDAVRIQNIIESSSKRSDAIIRLCRDELAPEFNKRLGTPFVLLITDGENNYCYDSESVLPKCHDIYKTIQSLVLPGNPFIIDPEKLLPDSSKEDLDLSMRLNNAVFIPLTIDENIKLSIGLLSFPLNKFPIAENPIEMSKVLARHVSASAVKPFLTTLKKWIEHDTKRKESMRITGNVCLSVGRSQLSLLTQLKQSFPQLINNHDFQRIHNLAENLQSTGSILESLSTEDCGSKSQSRPITYVPVKKIIESECASLNNISSPDMINIQGDCDIPASAGDLSFMFSGVLQWFAQRLSYTPPNIEPRIFIKCINNNNGVDLFFEDSSVRLDKSMREQLLAPFAEPPLLRSMYDDLEVNSNPFSSLFLTKLLLEVRYNGVLEDVSDKDDELNEEVKKSNGHKFRLHFPDASIRTESLLRNA